MRNDPRKNNVSIENITFRFYPEIITSYDLDLERCREAALNQINLVYFFSAVKIKIAAGMFNITQAKEKNITFVNCTSDSAINKTVIILRKSEFPSIERDKNNKDCYIINVGNCDNSLAMEKFMLAIMKQIQPEDK